MSRYTLNTIRIGRDKGPSEGEHDLVNVLTEGHYQSGHASASLPPEGHDGAPGSCKVFVPASVSMNAALAHSVVRHLFCKASDGTRHYDFATREEALAFLRRLYDIDAPKPQRADAITVSPRSVPAPSARNVVPSPAPAPTGTAYRAAFYGTAVTPHLFKRNTQ